MFRVLRAHHGMCFQFYKGKEYDEEFTNHMDKIICELEANPNCKVCIVSEADVVCKNCPNNKSGVCLSQCKVKTYDLKVLEVCGIREKEEMSYERFITPVKEKVIDTGLYNGSVVKTKIKDFYNELISIVVGG